MCRFAFVCAVALAGLSGVAGDFVCSAANGRFASGDPLVLNVRSNDILDVTYVANCGYGNVAFDVETGPDFTGLRWQERTLALSEMSQRYAWLCEPDGDLWMVSVSSAFRRACTNGWYTYTLPIGSFSHQPRGNKKPEIDTVNRILMGFNYANQRAELKDVTILRDPPLAAPALPACPPPTAESVRVCVLDADSSAVACISALTSAGIAARLVSCAEIAHAKWFSKASADLLVIPCSPFFPLDAVPNFKKFLRDGGAFFAFGGYAFDHLVHQPTDPVPDRPRVRAAELAAHTKGGLHYINSRFGQPGDAVRIAPDAVQVFQPNNVIEYAVAARATSAQSLLPAGDTFPYTIPARPYPAAIADVGRGDVVFTQITGRWMPVLETVDRFGRSRGALVSIVHNYAGVYAKASWAFSAHPTLFRSGRTEETALFCAIVKNLLARCFIRTCATKPVTANPGASVTLVADVTAPEGTEIAFALEGRPCGRVRVQKDRATLAVMAPTTGGVFRVCANLMDGDCVVDRLETGLCVRTPPPAVPRFVWKDNYFHRLGRAKFLCGVNQTGMPWFSSAENPLVWQRDFELMADHALSVERLIHFMAAAKPSSAPLHGSDVALILTNFPPAMIARTDAIVQTANAAGVAPLIALHDWIPIELSEGEFTLMDRWDDFWVRRYADWPLLTWDMQNEIHPLRFWRGARPDRNFRERITPLVTEFYDERRIPVPARALTFAKDGLWAYPDPKKLKWEDAAGRDFELFRVWLVSRWMKRIHRSVHAVRDDISVAPGFTRFDSAERCVDTDGLDYSVAHTYDVLPITRGNLKLVDRRFEGKGFVMGEYGCRESHAARAVGRDGNPDEAMTDYLLQQNLAFYGMGAAGAFYWTWKDNLGAEFPWGLNWPDLVPKRAVGVLRNLSLVLGSGTPDGTAQPELFFILPDGARLAGDAKRTSDCLVTAVDRLLRQNVPFGVINERNLARLPSSARALVWPFALAPNEKDFKTIVAFVQKGGALLVSGSPIYDDVTHQPTHPERLVELGVGERPNILWQSNVVERADGAAIDAVYGKFVREVASLKPVSVPAVAGTGCCYRLAQTDGEALVRDETPFLLRCAGAARLVALGRGGVPGLVANAGEVCAFLALDGRDLATSQMILALPFGPASKVQLLRTDATPLACELGEFRGGRWTPLEIQSASPDVVFAVDGATATDLRLFAPPARLAEARQLAERLLERP